MLIIHAAGNDGVDIDSETNYHYPITIYDDGARAGNIIDTTDAVLNKINQSSLRCSLCDSLATHRFYQDMDREVYQGYGNTDHL